MDDQNNLGKAGVFSKMFANNRHNQEMQNKSDNDMNNNEDNKQQGYVASEPNNSIEPGNAFSNTPESKQSIEILKAKESANEDELVMILDPNKIANWEYHDRQDYEEGNLKELAESMREYQEQPIVVVKKDHLFKPVSGQDDAYVEYVVIAGNRRWKAAVEHGLNIRAIRREMTFQEAIKCQENENVKHPICDYSKAKLYKKLLDSNALSEEQINQVFKSDKDRVRYIALLKIDPEIVEAVGDMSKVTKSIGEKINAIQNRSPEHKQALVQCADLIRQGRGGAVIERNVLEKMGQNIKPVTPTQMIDGTDFEIKYQSGKFQIPRQIRTHLTESDIEKILEKIEKSIPARVKKLLDSNRVI